MSNYTEDNVQVMPAAAVIEERLRTVLDIGSDIERVYKLFAARIGGSDKVPPGVQLAWELSIHDVANQPGSVPMLGGLMNMNFERYMRAVFIEDPKFAEAVIAWREMVLADMRSRKSAQL